MREAIPMRSILPAILTITVFLGLAGSTCGQNISFDDPPRKLVPKQPTRQELERRESLHKYVFGLQCVKEDRFAEALKAFEEAARLDPDAPALFKAQVPILLGMDRYADALGACKKIVALDPEDYAIWYVQAKLHKTTGQYPEAIADLKNGLVSVDLNDHPEAAQQLYIELGQLYESTDKFGPAADAFNRAAAILEHPDQIAAKAHLPREAILARASETYEKIGQLYRKAKQYDDAIAALAKAQERAPERAPRLSFLLAQVCQEQGNLTQALTHVDAYLRTQPLSTDPYELKIRLLRRLKQADAIVAWLEEAAQRERFNDALQILLAKEYASAKLPKKAEAIYQKLAVDSPSAELYRGLFHLYQDEGPAGMTCVLTMLDKFMAKANRIDGPRPVSAIEHAKAMVAALREDGELGPKLVEAAARQKEGQDGLTFETVYFLALLADKHRQNDEAERFYRQCLKSKSVSPANEPALYGGLLRVLGNARKHEAVVKVCHDGLANAKDTNPLLFHKELARALASLKRHDEALGQADVGAKKADGDGRFLFEILRIRILTMAERYTDAETECTALLKNHERPAESFELRYLLSNIYSAAKRQGKAEEQLVLILKIDPDNATVNNDLAYLWAEQGKNLAAAEQMIRKALDLERSQRRRKPNWTAEDDKDNAAYVDSLGWVLFRRGQIGAARKELERAVTLNDGDDPVIYEHLGDVYSRMKMRPEASRAWQRAVELYEQGVRGNDAERVRDIRRKIDQVKEEISESGKSVP
jgi:tetratricopeptide (TPR) repeat protein